MRAFRGTQIFLAVVAIGFGLPACTTPEKLSSTQLEAIGVQEGAKYWDAEQKLAQRGYSCYVSGADRENFDCTRSAGVLPSCILRITFVVNDKNLVSRLTVSDPACMGTP